MVFIMKAVTGSTLQEYWQRQMFCTHDRAIFCSRFGYKVTAHNHHFSGQKNGTSKHEQIA